MQVLSIFPVLVIFSEWKSMNKILTKFASLYKFTINAQVIRDVKKKCRVHLNLFHITNLRPREWKLFNKSLKLAFKHYS